MFGCYSQAIKRFNSSHEKSTKKLKALFWFIVKWKWVCGMQRRFKNAGIDDILQLHPFIYYMFRMHSFMTRFNREDEIANLVFHHYHSLKQRFSDSAIRQIFGDGLVITHLELPLSKVDIKIQYDHRMRFEGQLSLKLMVDQKEFYFINYLLSEEAIWIGGFQGGKGHLDLNKDFTKQAYGLRPQNFLIFMLTLLANYQGVNHLYGVRKQAHVYQNEQKSRYKVKFDYDAFWMEIGGEGVDGEKNWMRLPTEYPRKPLEQVPSKKRSLYRKRYQFMDEAATKVSIPV